jgi:hypothetical protein
MVDKLDELIDHLVTPKRHRVLKDAQGEVVGVEAEADPHEPSRPLLRGRSIGQRKGLRGIGNP